MDIVKNVNAPWYVLKKNIVIIPIIMNNIEPIFGLNHAVIRAAINMVEGINWINIARKFGMSNANNVMKAM